MSNVLEMHNITKRFPGVLANDQQTSNYARAKFTFCWAKTALENRH